MAWVDLFMSVYFVALIPAYLIVGTGLIKEINKRCETEEVRRKENSPAVTPLVKILTLQCIAMFLRAIFVSFYDIQKVQVIDSISKGSDYWPIILGI